MKVTPYNTKESKKQQVTRMFDTIAPKYDLLNHLLSAGIDRRWRKQAIKLLEPHSPKIILDMACGTGDFSFEALRLKPRNIVGADLSEEMLAIARQKAVKKKVADSITFKKADAERLPFKVSTFDAVIVAFGVRNFEHLEKGLEEFYRVLVPGGRVVILEFSSPAAFPVKQLYNFYFKNLLPTIGRLVSKDKKAYSYLPESVYQFPQGDAFLEILQQCGFHSVRQKKLGFGICSIYYGEK